jgi:hypothetical protein
MINKSSAVECVVSHGRAELLGICYERSTLGRSCTWVRGIASLNTRERGVDDERHRSRSAPGSGLPCAHAWLRRDWVAYDAAVGDDPDTTEVRVPHVRTCAAVSSGSGSRHRKPSCRPVVLPHSRSGLGYAAPRSGR